VFITLRTMPPVVFGTHSACGNDPPVPAAFEPPDETGLLLAGFDWLAHATNKSMTQASPSARFVMRMLPSEERPGLVCAQSNSTRVTDNTLFVKGIETVPGAARSPHVTSIGIDPLCEELALS